MSATTTTEIGPPPKEAPGPRLHRLERPALAGVLVREVVNFSSYWRSMSFSAIVEPCIYLLAFGFGFGALVNNVGGYKYVEFVATGTVGSSVLMTATLSAMYGTFIKYQRQRTYDAILAAPVDTEELVSAEALWIGVRAGLFGCIPLIVGMFFGVDPTWGMLTVPFVAILTGLGWALFGIFIAGASNAMENFNYITSTVITPLFLVSGTFFPLDTLPPWVEIAAQLNPLYHTVELVRAASLTGWDGWIDVWHLTVLILFPLLIWRVAIRVMQRKLID